MASPTETPARPQGFGARRFLVRGSIYAPEPAPSILRFRYTDYPERRALLPDFPFPGRRGGSRPRAESAEEVDRVLRTGSLYPAPKTRDTTPLDTRPAPERVFIAEEGDSCFSSPLVTTLQTRVLATPRIPRPFSVFHLQYWSEAATPDPVALMALMLKFAPDNDLTGGFDTSGINILQLGFGISAVGTVFEPYVTVQQHFPFSRTFEEGTFIKFIWRNNSAGSLHGYCTISIKYQD